MEINSKFKKLIFIERFSIALVIFLFTFGSFQAGRFFGNKEGTHSWSCKRGK